MIPVLMKLLLSSVFVGLIDAVCLRPFAIRHGFAQIADLRFGLPGAMAIPLLIPLAARLHFHSINSSIVRAGHSMTLLQELQAMLQDKSVSGPLPEPIEPIQSTNPPRARRTTSPGLGSTPAPSAQETGPSSSKPAPEADR